MYKVLIIIALLLFSCEKSLILVPKMQIAADEAFATPENLYAAIIGCYDGLQAENYYGRNFIIVGDLASDNSIANGTKLEYYKIDDNELLSDNIIVEGIWADIYTAINRVNYVISKIESVDFLTDTEKNDYQGQLLFLRALHYYNLVRLYGKIPLKLEPTLNDNPENFIGRTEIQTVYNQIISDLEFAKRNISNRQTHKATAIAANALLADVYLTTKDYTKAKRRAEEVLAENSFLEPDYAQLFAQNIEPSNEILFFIAYNPDDKNRLAEYHFPNTLGGRYEIAPSPKLLNMINERDARKNIIAAEHHGNFYAKKYSDLVTGTDRIPVIRIAEIFLIRAEANYFLDSVGNYNRILNDLNLIRTRANLDEITANNTYNLFQLIENEKQIEFAFEGKRWFDLIRNNRAISLVSTVTDNHQMLFPIPLSEILTNPHINFSDQNEGY